MDLRPGIVMQKGVGLIHLALQDYPDCARLNGGSQGYSVNRSNSQQKIYKVGLFNKLQNWCNNPSL